MRPVLNHPVSLARPRLRLVESRRQLLHKHMVQNIRGELFCLQWNKLLAAMYEGVTTGVHGTKELIGGTTPEGIAPRARLQLEIEKLMGAGP